MKRKEAIEVIKKNWPDSSFTMLREALETVIPELKESEDERIRKEIITYLSTVEDKELIPYESWIAWLEKQGKNNMGISEATKQKLEDNLNKALEKETPESWNEFLEKQGEQKPAEWHREDEQNLNACLGFIPDAYLCRWLKDVIHVKYDKPAWSEEDEAIYYGVIETEQYMLDVVNGIKKFAVGNISIKEECTRELNWLKSLKERVQPQPKQEWSGGDEAHLHSLITHLEQWIERHPNTTGADVQGENIAWLKSLRPQNWTKEDKERYISCLQRLGTGNPAQPETINSKWFKEHVYLQNRWKPSDEQMKGIECAIKTLQHQLNVGDKRLNSLYDDLKKLREE